MDENLIKKTHKSHINLFTPEIYEIKVYSRNLCDFYDTDRVISEDQGGGVTDINDQGNTTNTYLSNNIKS